jgi:DNA primase
LKDFSSVGNSVAFVMEHEHFTYPEAIRYLARKYNIEIEETEQTNEEKQIQIFESMYLVSEFAKDYFHKTLLKSEEGKPSVFLISKKGDLQMKPLKSSA